AMERAAVSAAFDRDSLCRYSQRIWTLVEGNWARRPQVSPEQVLLARIEAIYPSPSWRLTGPLRGLSPPVPRKGFAAPAPAPALGQFQTSLRSLWNWSDGTDA